MKLSARPSSSARTAAAEPLGWWTTIMISRPGLAHVSRASPVADPRAGSRGRPLGSAADRKCGVLVLIARRDEHPPSIRTSGHAVLHPGVRDKPLGARRRVAVVVGHATEQA